MNMLKKIVIRGIGSNLLVLFAILLLPAFLLTDNVNVFQELVDYIFKPD
ncbi:MULTISPECIES: hypothetical protein [Fictibacillus]|nr:MULTISPECIES: hypothetical protein [Fictibacillus]SCC41413.1 hypothetical protein GA0061096_4629 [Fictibacillus enclensis]